MCRILLTWGVRQPNQNANVLSGAGTVVSTKIDEVFSFFSRAREPAGHSTSIYLCSGQWQNPGDLAGIVVVYHPNQLETRTPMAFHRTLARLFAGNCWSSSKFSSSTLTLASP